MAIHAILGRRAALSIPLLIACFLPGAASGGTAPPELALVFEYFFRFVPREVSLDSFPTTVSHAVASDVTSIRDEIAALTGLSSSDVRLAGAMFTVGSFPLDPEKSATLVAGTGSMLRLDRLQDSTIRARACSAQVGEEPVLRTDTILPADGAVLLVPITIEQKVGIVAYRITVKSSDDFEIDPLAPQREFRGDVAAHLDQEPFKMSAGEMAGYCPGSGGGASHSGPAATSEVSVPRNAAS